ncbi:hypothetical protein [Lactobacillus helveticus]|uniref:hypothetical protein n=1 Tax=Lactobacillus helveticus TaxID=1587 RepID=UPI002181F854
MMVSGQFLAVGVKLIYLLKKNVIKEVKEEAGIDIAVKRLIAIHDSNRHYKGMFPYGITTVFFLCESVGGSFMENDRVTAKLDSQFLVDDPAD